MGGHATSVITDPPCDAQIVAAVRAGPEGLGQLHEAYFGRLRTLCYQRVRDHHAAQDLASETILRAGGCMSRFRDKEPLWPWLRVIAVRLCIDHLRRRAREALSDHSGDRDGARDADVHERDLLDRALAQLNPRQRRALLMCYVLDWAVPDAARHLSIGVPAMEQLLHRARGNLLSAYRRLSTASASCRLAAVVLVLAHRLRAAASRSDRPLQRWASGWLNPGVQLAGVQLTMAAVGAVLIVGSAAGPLPQNELTGPSDRLPTAGVVEAASFRTADLEMSIEHRPAVPAAGAAVVARPAVSVLPPVPASSGIATTPLAGHAHADIQREEDGLVGRVAARVEDEGGETFAETAPEVYCDGTVRGTACAAFDQLSEVPPPPP